MAALTATNKLSILFLARSLDVGGAEGQLVVLAKALRQLGHEIGVAVFYGGGGLEAELAGTGVEIVHLRKTGRWDFAGFLIRTARAVRRIRPDVLYSFLGGGNIAAALTRPFARGTMLVWSVRNSNFDMSVDHWLARLGYRLETMLSHSPEAIIANSSAGRDFAISRGFPARTICLVGNGIDTNRFQPRHDLRTKQRRKLGLGNAHIAVGTLARLNATKDLPTFLRAAARVSRAVPDARFLCVGGGPLLGPLRHLAAELGIADFVMFTGEIDAAKALNAFDLFCSSSITEGFSNATAEAMACGLPCIVTDVGDSAELVGHAGVVVPPSSPAALAEAIEQQIHKLHAYDSTIPRQRILDNFSTEAMIERTLAVFRSVLSR